jgi:4-amino-4-deoxy-L-arabinose transferase-like glycosyltransferase
MVTDSGYTQRFVATSRTLHAALLAAPFVVVIAATSGLRRAFWVYQAYDEQAHYQIVVTVARTWPRLVLSGYGSWSGPLVYWLLAGLSRPFGTSLVSGRLVVSVLSWLACVAAYVVFRDRLGARPWVALALALMLALSPFFFGQSFRVLTDNPTWLFVVLALERLLAYVQAPRSGRLAAFAAFAAVATLMRQSAAWLFVAGLVAVFCVRVPSRSRAWGAAIVTLGVVPLAALLVRWGGLLPSGAAQAGSGVFRLRNVCLSLAVVGLWGVLLAPADGIAALPGRLHRRGVLAVAAAALVGLTAVAAGAMASLRGGDPYGIGLLGRVGQAWWRVLGTSLVWWTFVPLGAAVLAALFATRWRRPSDRVLLIALAAIVLSCAANTTWYQRYVDFAVLLLLGGLVASGAARVRRLDALRWLGILLISLLWTAVLARA